jgi:hypothetical protein
MNRCMCHYQNIYRCSRAVYAAYNQQQLMLTLTVLIVHNSQEPYTNISAVMIQRRTRTCIYFPEILCGLQCFGVGSGLDPDSIRSVDSGLDPLGKNDPPKYMKKFRNFMFFKVLDVLF